MASNLSDPAGWYAFKTDKGQVGLVKHGGGAFQLGNGQQVVSATYLGDATQTMGALLSSSGPKIESALVKLGATPQQMTAFMAEATAGAPTNPRLGGGVGGAILNAFGVDPIIDGSNPTQFNIPTSGNPTASAGTAPVSTALQGNADAGPSASVEISGIWSWLTTAANWVRILEFVGGAVLIYLAVKGLTGIDTPTVSDAAKVAAVAPK